MLPFTREELAQALKDGDVTERSHPHLPLRIYNYSPEIQYTNKWTRVTRACRGLILDEFGNIVARPWEKFFNLGQVELPIQFDDPVEVMDKADGSLGILYPSANGYSISTRGSFESKQAIDATKIWNERYSHLNPEPGYTMLFEILLPWNRIVIDYFHGDNHYLSNYRRILSQGSSRDDSREHVHSTQQGLENLPGMPVSSTKKGSGEECREAQCKCARMECEEPRENFGIQEEAVRKNSGCNSGSQKGQTVCGLWGDFSSGSDGFRPYSGKRQEEIQYRASKEPSTIGGRTCEMRTGVFELSQSENICHEEAGVSESRAETFETEGELVLLGAVANETGYYMSPTVAKSMFYVQGDEQQREYVGWMGPVIDVYPYKSISEALGAMGRKGKEGYVIRSNNFMVKVKEPEYLDLHRLVTNISPKTVWEKLKDGKTKSQIISLFPDEFHAYVGSMIDPLVEKFNERYLEIREGYEKAIDGFMSSGEPFDRGRFARSIKNAKDKRYYFLLLDDKPIRDVLWSELRPREVTV